MATSPLAQVAETALDAAGISVCTTTPSAANARLGTVYSSTDFAAAQPVWFHPTADGHFLFLARRRWHSVTPDGGNPGAFTAYTEDLSPCWVLLDGPTGRRTDVPGYPLAVPLNTTTTTHTLVAAGSNPPDQLFLLYAATIGGQSAAVLQRIHLQPTGAIAISAEEVLPVVGDVVFDAGLHLLANQGQVTVYGTDAAGQIYCMRKPASHVGVNRATTRQTYASLTGSPQGWEYWTGTGYHRDETPAPLGPTTAGPLSFAQTRTALLMTTVEHAEGAYTGHGWTSVVGQPFKKTALAVALGSDAEYLGGGVALQPLLTTALSPTGVAVVPYVVSTKVTDNGADSLFNQWNTWSLS